MANRFTGPEDPVERFWSKVHKTDSCWLWQGTRDRYGYGSFRVGNRMLLAHRFAYASENDLPDRKPLDHICHNRACVRPSHLRLVTHKQNQENKAGLAANNTSGYRGVSWNNASKKWEAQFTSNYRRHNVGLFESLEEAAEAVRSARNATFTHNDLDR